MYIYVAVLMLQLAGPTGGPMTSATAPAPCNDDDIGGCTLAVRVPAAAAPSLCLLLLLRTLLG